MSTPRSTLFSRIKVVRLGIFQIGSAVADLLTSAVWNRIMITDLGFAAWPVALLSSLRYLLAPLAIWVGHQSDHVRLWGYKRTSYIAIGRGMMVAALALLPVSVLLLAKDAFSLSGWAAAVFGFLFYGLGTAISGAPFLAFVKDSFPYRLQGRAIGVIQIFLIAGFSTLPIAFGLLMPVYDQEAFTRLVIVATVLAAVFWIGSLAGMERRVVSSKPVAAPPLAFKFRLIWSETITRRYAIFVGVSGAFAFMQDVLLEPFGGDVFGLSLGDTTRFNAYWGVGVLVGMVGTHMLTRYKPPHEKAMPTLIGIVIMALSLALIGFASVSLRLSLVYPALVIFGLGFGMFGIGGYGLLMAMSGSKQAGLYLALWSVIQLTARGLGMAVGGILRDINLFMGLSMKMTYATVFWIEAVGLALAVFLLTRVDFETFAQRQVEPEV